MLHIWGLTEGMKNMKRLLTLLIALSTALLSGCGAAPAVAGAPGVIADWLPTIFGYLGTAQSALNLLRAWVKRFEHVPAVAERLPELDSFFQEATESFEQARELTRKGAEFEEQAKAAYAQGRQALDKAVALAESLGMYSQGKLVRPPEPEGRAGCPRTDSGPDEVVLELPPNQV